MSKMALVVMDTDELFYKVRDKMYETASEVGVAVEQEDIELLWKRILKKVDKGESIDIHKIVENKIKELKEFYKWQGELKTKQ